MFGVDVSPSERLEAAYDRFTGLPFSVQIWLVTLAFGLFGVLAMGGASISIVVAGLLTGLLVRVMYD